MMAGGDLDLHPFLLISAVMSNGKAENRFGAALAQKGFREQARSFDAFRPLRVPRRSPSHPARLRNNC
jgi:hypothetical protein